MSVWVSLRAGPIAAASGDNTLLTVGEGHAVTVTKFHIVNTSASANIVVKFGIGASTDDSLISPAITIPKKQMIDKYVNANLGDSEILVLNASATGITVTTNYDDLYPHL